MPLSRHALLATILLVGCANSKSVQTGAPEAGAQATEEEAGGAQWSETFAADHALTCQFGSDMCACIGHAAPKHFESPAELEAFESTIASMKDIGTEHLQKLDGLLASCEGDPSEHGAMPEHGRQFVDSLLNNPQLAPLVATASERRGIFVCVVAQTMGADAKLGPGTLNEGQKMGLMQEMMMGCLSLHFAEVLQGEAWSESFAAVHAQVRCKETEAVCSCIGEEAPKQFASPSELFALEAALESEEGPTPEQKRRYEALLASCEG